MTEVMRYSRERFELCSKESMVSFEVVLYPGPLTEVWC